MDLLKRYWNLSVLLVAILLQMLLLAYQIKDHEVRLVRVWAVGAVTPLAKAIEAGRSGISHYFRNYFALLDVRQENQRLTTQVDREEMENQYLRAQLSTAETARALEIFQASSQSKTVAARVIANTTDAGSNAIIDRGSSDGIQKGMAVIKPGGIVGKVISVYSGTSFVLLINDPTFAAGVVSQKHHVHGTLKGQGVGTVVIDYVQNEETVEQGEWFFASGDDGIFPRGIPAGQATVVRPGRSHKEIFLTPSGLQGGLEDVLVVVNGVHGVIPDALQQDQPPIHQLPPPPPDGSASTDAPVQNGVHLTDLDRAAQDTRSLGDGLGIRFGDGKTPAPNFNLVPPSNQAPAHGAAPPPGSPPHP
jgi:rod shape-determining protein MreC